jgi:putative oxidoreductase
MERFLGRYSTYFYAILRIVAGFLFILHGTQKFFGYPPPPGGAGSGELSALMVVAATIEVLGGTLIMIGLFTSVAAFIASGMMAVAYFMVHQPMGVWPITNRGELAALYCFVFLYIASRGSGVWSVDSMFRGPRPSEMG